LFEEGGLDVKLVRRLARVGELLLARAPVATLGAPRKWS
jgi:hypothetical protein